MHLDDTVDLVLGQVRQRDIVAEKEAQTLVVIFKIERFAHAGRQLVDEAEHTMVGTAVLFVAQVGLEVAAQRLILTFFHLHGAVLFVLTELQRETFRRCIELVIQRIVQRVAVDGQQRAAYGDAEFFSRGIFVHRRYVQGHRFTLLVITTKNGEGIALPTQETYASFLMTSWPL